MFKHTNIKPRSGISVNRASSFAQGLVGMWLFNEGSGTGVRDLVTGQMGVLQNFALTGTTSNWVPTQFGGGINSDGSNDVINCGNNSGLQQISDRLSCLVRFTLTSLPHTFNQVIAKNNANTTYWGFLIGNTGLVRGQVIGTTTSALALSVGQTYEVCLTWDKNIASGLIKVYINGKQDSGTATNTTAMATGTNPLTFGSDAFNAGRQGAFTFEHARVYNRVLSPGEIAQLYLTPYIDLMYPKTYYRRGTERSYGYIIG